MISWFGRELVAEIIVKELSLMNFRYPRVSDASDEFLRDPENGVPKPVQDVVRMIRRGPDIRKTLDENPAVRKAYSFIKRWVAIRGVGVYLPDNQIFKTLLECRKDASDSISEHPPLTFSRLMNRFCEHIASKADPSLRNLVPSDFSAFSTDDWEAYLMELKELPAEEKMNCTFTIRIIVTYSGMSQIKGAQWLLMVQRKLSKLKERKSDPL